MLKRSLYNFAIKTCFVLALAGCGFTPVYVTNKGEKTPEIASELALIHLEPIADRNGQNLANELIDRLYEHGAPKKPRYALEVGFASSERSLGIRNDATATRAQLLLTASITLTDYNTGKVLFTDESRTVSSYNILQAQYGTVAAKRNAFERGTNELAQDILNRLRLFFARDVIPEKTFTPEKPSELRLK